MNSSNGPTVRSPEPREPIAIVGIGCRLPGNATGPQSFWEILRDGRDVLTEIPPDRWSLDVHYDPQPGRPGRTNVRHGGFLPRIDQFDAHFFGISPREATFMDPQQRLLLEVAWEALEDSGLVLERLAKTAAGVFVGISSFDYALLQNTASDLHAVDVYTNTGGAMSIAANRLSYCFDLAGPSVSVDTACSSALTAVQMACDSIWSKHCPLALVGGVHVLILPGPYIGFSRLNMLSADGRCKAFDARGNGFVRSEGAGVVVLKPLSAALADGDQVYALIRAAAINQDGRTSGLTVPSEHAQAELIREACRQAVVDPRRIRYVEAHGTGTQVGDPIEARALGAVLGAGRPADRPCFIGSVKTNVGHLEAAAGIVGLIKTALALKHRQIPANLHFEVPNPEIPFDELRLRVPVTLTPWPDDDGPALAGLNSFGFGGSNAHVILEEAPRRSLSAPSSGDDRPYLVPLSARSPEALRAASLALADWLEGPGATAPLDAVCRSAALRRSHHEYRLAVLAIDKGQLASKLRDLAADNGALCSDAFGFRLADGAGVGRAVPHQQPQLAFVCSGQGPQWWGMGRQLLAEEPVFRGMIERCDELMRPVAGWSLLDELTADESDSRMHVTAISQPAIFAIQVALAALWESWGVTPDAVVGHSVGEAAAAYLAGALSLEEAARVIVHRGRCMEAAPDRGRMLAVEMRREEALELAQASCGRVFLAAVNSPKSMTLSGDPEALEAVAQDLKRRQMFHRFLQVQYAFHSSQMDPVREPLLEALRDLRPRECRLPLFSTVTGQRLDGPELTADYWWRNVRQSVLFADAVDQLLDSGCTAAVELSPHPVLGGSVIECCRSRSGEVRVLASLRRQEPERPAMLLALAGLHAVGRSLDWSKVVPAGTAWVRLPTYSWQHETYWHESPESRERRLGTIDHPLLGRPCRTPQPSWESVLSCQNRPYLGDHRIQGAALIPATAFLEMALAAGHKAHAADSFVLEEIRLLKACFLPPGQARVLHTQLCAEESSFEISSRPEESRDQPWTAHVRGGLRTRPAEAREATLALDEIRGRCPIEWSGDTCYDRFRQVGIEYGPSFRGLQHLWAGDGEALALVEAPAELSAHDGYRCHPALLDACFQATVGVLPPTNGAILLPVEIEQVRVHARLSPKLWCHARLVERNRQGPVTEVSIFNEAGQLVVEVRGLQTHLLGGDSGETADDLLYEYRWQLRPRAGREIARRGLDYLPGLEPLGKQVRQQAASLTRESDLLDRFTALEPDLDRLCAVYIRNALLRLGADFQPGDRFSTAAVLERLDILPEHRRLMDRLLTALAEDGVIHREGDGWEVVRDLAVTDARPHWLRLLERDPAFFGEFALLERCASRLHEVLRGTANPVHLIFPEGSLATTEHLYQDSPSVRYFNAVARLAIRRALDALPAGRTVRVLEIGAGTGGLTSHVLPWLPADRVEYTFTDVSSHFFARAQQKLADYPFVQYQRLNIEEPSLEQGFAAHGFDLILASHVLHATRDLRTALRHVRELLSSDGLLVLLEVVGLTRWVELVFGLTDGWWRFTDTDLRQSSPLLSVPQWHSLLADEGFSETVELAHGPARSLDSAVLLARGPSLAPEKQPEIGSASAQSAPGGWIFLADRGGRAEQLTAWLRDRGESCVLAFAGAGYQEMGDGRFTVAPGSANDFRRLLSCVLGPGRPPCVGVVHLWNLDAPAVEDLAGASPSSFQVAGSLSVVNLIQAWNDQAGLQSPRLWLVTRQAQSVNLATDGRSMLHTPLWGLGRVVINEYHRLRCKLIDLGDASSVELRALFEELQSPDEEDEIALRGEARYIHRFVGASADCPEGGTDASDGAASFRLEAAAAGTLDGLTLRAFERAAPGPGQVEIEVQAAALNFSDVMKALGLYPGLPDGPVPLGVECSGIVSAIGPGVEDFRVGDEVLAIAPHSFASHVVTLAVFVARKPARISFEEAATIPIAFLTAAYALEHLGRLTEGERVLVHAASGGVGLAAIQLIRRAGAVVLATAGSPEKRQFLQALGVEHVMDSRSLAFADEVMAITGGQGVDVVLNSLAGEAIPKGLAALADHGRFLEIGKRDVYANSHIGLKPFRKNLSFLAIDLDRALRDRPRLLSRLFRELVAAIEAGQLHPLPHRVFPVGQGVSAFRFMSQAKQIGKVVLSMERPARIAPPRAGTALFRPDATYLLTGGLGGFGLTVAHWMVEQGARHLVLMGRRGIHTPDAAERVEALRLAGAEVLVAQGDVARREDIARVLADIARDMPPLRGVLHMAMVLEDSLLLNLEQDRWMRIMEPKVDGAWNLHEQTRAMALDHFILFSSMTSVFGLPGQASYAASNTFLDALAFYRRSLGLSGLTVSWGYIGEVGWVARHEKVAERLQTQGVRSIAPPQALALLGTLLRRRAVHASVANVDFTTMRFLGTSKTVSPRFAALYHDHGGSDEGSRQEGATIRKTVLAAPPEKRLEVMSAALRDKVARVLGASAARVAMDRPLTELGFDSLMAVELRNWIEGELRVNLPIVELMQSPTVSHVAGLLVGLLAPEGEGEKDAVAPAPSPAANGAVNGAAHPIDGEKAQELLDNLERLSDAEVDSLLDTMLAEKERVR